MCAAILLVLLKTGLAWRLATDIPNDRSLHARPTPRVGGWGIVPVSVVAMLLVAPAFGARLSAAAFLAAVSQIDDRRGLPARVRFAAHLIAVVGLGRRSIRRRCPWWMLAVLSFLMLWLVNLYNFMDGADGLAGGMALFGFGGYAVAALTGAHPLPELALACACGGGGGAGLPVVQFPPGADFSRRRRVDLAGLSGWRAGLLGLAARGMAHLVSGAGIRAVHRRRVDYAWRGACCVAKNFGKPTGSTTINVWCVRAWAMPEPPLLGMW